MKKAQELDKLKAEFDKLKTAGFSGSSTQGGDSAKLTEEIAVSRNNSKFYSLN